MNGFLSRRNQLKDLKSVFSNNDALCHFYILVIEAGMVAEQTRAGKYAFLISSKLPQILSMDIFC